MSVQHFRHLRAIFFPCENGTLFSHKNGRNYLETPFTIRWVFLRKWLVFGFSINRIDIVPCRTHLLALHEATRIQHLRIYQQSSYQWVSIIADQSHHREKWNHYFGTHFVVFEMLISNFDVVKLRIQMFLMVFSVIRSSLTFKHIHYSKCSNSNQ